MPQIFQVLRCYNCLVFQVHQTRKDTKWICKICCEKQSVKRHYGIGTSKDCRTHVQKLNKLRGDKEETSVSIVESEDSDYDESIDNTAANIDNTEVTAKTNKESKWSAYIDQPEQQFETKKPEYLNNKELVFEIPQKRKLNRKQQNTKRLRKSIDNKENTNFEIHNHSDNETDSIGLSPTHIVAKTKNFNSEIINVCYKSNIESQIDTNIPNQNEVPNVILHKVNKDSKWAQYVDTKVLNKSDDEETEKNCYKQPLFSLCDDSEIDTILDL